MTDPCQVQVGFGQGEGGRQGVELKVAGVREANHFPLSFPY